MKNIKKHNYDYIHLYQNDVYGLEKSLKII